MKYYLLLAILITNFSSQAFADTAESQILKHVENSCMINRENREVRNAYLREQGGSEVQGKMDYWDFHPKKDKIISYYKLFHTRELECLATARVFLGNEEDSGIKRGNFKYKKFLKQFTKHFSAKYIKRNNKGKAGDDYHYVIEHDGDTFYAVTTYYDYLKSLKINILTKDQAIQEGFLE